MTAQTYRFDRVSYTSHLNDLNGYFYVVKKTPIGLICYLLVQNGDEDRLSYPKHYLDLYSQTKAQAEQLIIAANGSLNCTFHRWFIKFPVLIYPLVFFFPMEIA